MNTEAEHEQQGSKFMESYINNMDLIFNSLVTDCILNSGVSEDELRAGKARILGYTLENGINFYSVRELVSNSIDGVEIARMYISRESGTIKIERINGESGERTSE